MLNIYLKWGKPRIPIGLLVLLPLLSSCGASAIEKEKQRAEQERQRRRESEKERRRAELAQQEAIEGRWRVEEEKRREVEARRSAEAAQRRMAEARSLSSNTSATTPRPSHSIIRSHMANENSGIHTGNVVHPTEPAAGNSHRPITQREVINNIAYFSRRYELGEQNATTVANRGAITTLGETGTGKGTSINYWMGCDMVLRTPEALGLQGRLEDVIVVDPESTQPEVASIGHGIISHTLMPQIIQDPHCGTRVYCDCPGFSDNRGAAINIANAINIRQVLQQASGIKAVFLARYKDFDRGHGIERMEDMCQQLFGGVDNLRRYQNSVLLGINRAPAQTSIDKVRTWLTSMNSPAIQILGQRAFLYDPLEQGGGDFWSRDRFLTEIEQMPAIPQQVARNLFQTVLTGDDKVMLQQIVEHQVEALCNALEQNDYPAVDRCWSLLNQLQIIAHQRIDELINRQVRPHMRAYAEERTAAFARHAAQHQFTEAEQLLISLRTLNERFPDEHLVDLEELEGTLQATRAQQAAQQEAEEEARRAEEEARRAEEEAQRAKEEARKERSATVTMRSRIEEMEHELERIRNQKQNH